MTRIALVTGGSGGIGAATCHALAASGHTVLVGYGSNADAAGKVAADAPGEASPLHVDVTDEDSVAAAVAHATERGTLAVVVNNAGVADDDLLLRLDPARFDRTIEVNLRGAYLVSRAAMRPMLRARFGRIVNIASVVALRGNVGQTAYAASKAGLIGFSKSLAREVGRKGVTVNVVAPGFVATPMTDALGDEAREALRSQAPTGRAVEPDEVAATVAFLASDVAGSTTGAVIPVDGGAGI
ncbi:3-oxoacyl-ACP reductase family protein [Egicoccus halophilus]|uniref:Beta-ketoacyl-ACP reductase n=1 Tax=Egicoccus halophilus TaxID=1670830 RepID=A0A8J3ETT7_9ACTN|nr:3-oxoacyl-ACP reductase family protein [Egicoccus halophilus]GGI06256.1 beta-ketoacyl-ACP reductase [Egicoccus halophilus]